VPLAGVYANGTLVVLLLEEHLSGAKETVRCRLSVRSAIQMRGSISNRKRGMQSNRQARIIKTTRTALK
jgi:hypothetical protein